MGLSSNLIIFAMVTSLEVFSFCMIIFHPRFNPVMDEVGFRVFLSIFNRINSLYCIHFWELS